MHPELITKAGIALIFFLHGALLSFAAMKDGISRWRLHVLIQGTTFVLFPLLGRNYQAAVLSAGFTGLSLGATPTAIASMTAVTKHYGPSPNAFIVLPLVSAFFVDIATWYMKSRVSRAYCAS